MEDIENLQRQIDELNSTLRTFQNAFMSHNHTNFDGTPRLRLVPSDVRGFYTGVGSPEGAVVAFVGSLYLRNDGSTASTLYIKETGSGSTGWSAVGSSSNTGVMYPFAGSSVPTGYLLCDGTSYLRTDYAALFAAIGTTYGSADSTHFNVPDARGMTLVGYKSGDANFGTLGGTLGEATHTLTINEMPSHNHPGTYGNNVWNTNGANGSTAAQGVSAVTLVTPGVVSQGGGAAHNNIQPTLVVNYIIKT